MTRVVAPAADCGFGVNSFNHTADQTIAHTLVSGWTQNIACQSFAGGLTLSDVISVGAWSASWNYGQPIYCDRIRGPVVVDNCLFGLPGGGGPPGEFQHAGYWDMGCSPPVIRRSIFAAGPNAGPQLRPGGEIDDSVILDCATGVLAQNRVKLVNCVVFAGHYYREPNSPHATGNTALRAYYPAECRNCLFVGRPHQGNAPPWLGPGGKAYPQGCVVVGGAWSNKGEAWAAPPAGTQYLSGGGNTISGWPGPAFVGCQQPAGWAVKPDPVSYDYRPVLDAVLARKISPADGAARIAADVRALVK